MSFNSIESKLDEKFGMGIGAWMKFYRLTAPDGSIYESTIPGEIGGYSCERIYGQLDCWSARLALPKGYAQHRVFFADEAAAIAAGYRPCAKCMPAKYNVWKRGGELETVDYPWKTLPKPAKPKAGKAVSL